MSTKHYTTIAIDGGALGELECDVEYWYTPYYQGGFDEPPTDEDWEIQSIQIKMYDSALNHDVYITATDYPGLYDYCLDAVKCGDTW